MAQVNYNIHVYIRHILISVFWPISTVADAPGNHSDQNSDINAQVDQLQQAQPQASPARAEELKMLRKALETALSQTAHRTERGLAELRANLDEYGASMLEKKITFDHIKHSLDGLQNLT